MSDEHIRKSALLSSIFITVSNLLFLNCLPGLCHSNSYTSDIKVFTYTAVNTDNGAAANPDSLTPGSASISPPLSPSTSAPTSSRIASPTLTSTPLSTSDKTGSNTNIEKKIKNYIEPRFKIAGSYSRLLQKYSGATVASEFVTDLILYFTLKKIFGGKVKVQVKTYSLTDLWHLKVKNARISLKGSHYKDIPLGIVDIESQTPFWATFKHHHLEVMHPALFSFKMQISESELDKMLHSPTVTNSLRALRLDLASLGPGLGEQRLQMHEPEVTLEDDLIKVKANLATQGANPSTFVLMTVSGQPKLHGHDRIFLENIKVDSADIDDPEKFSQFVENLINPLINLYRFDKPHFALRLDEISIKSKTVIVSGRVILGPHVPKPSLN